VRHSQRAESHDSQRKTETSQQTNRAVDSQAHNRSFGNGNEKHNRAAAGYNGRSRLEQDKRGNFIPLNDEMTKHG
jgi:hypothetical protein